MIPLPPSEVRQASASVLAAMDDQYRTAAEIALRARIPWRRVARLLSVIGSRGPVEHGYRTAGGHTVSVWRKRGG